MCQVTSSTLGTNWGHLKALINWGQNHNEGVEN